MSGEFYNLLSHSNRNRCRKIDQIICSEDFRGEIEEYSNEDNETMHLYTFDMDIDGSAAGSNVDNALDGSRSDRFKTKSAYDDALGLDSSLKISNEHAGSLKSSYHSRRQMSRRRSAVNTGGGGNDLDSDRNGNGDGRNSKERKKFELPTGTALYEENLWLRPDIRRIRKRFNKRDFFEKFDEGLKCYINKDWEAARDHFKYVAENFDDGPSLYFLEKMDKTGNIPPRLFNGYGCA